jgi:hypothetical protein
MDDPDGCHPECFTFAMLTDVPDGVRHALMHAAVDRLGVHTADQPCDPVGLATRVARAAAEGLLDASGRGVSWWPTISAALLEPHVTDRLRLDEELESRQWWDLAERLPRPAADVCAALADLADEVA